MEETQIIAFVKSALNQISELSEKLEKVSLEKETLSKELKKVSQEKVVLEKVASQKNNNIFSEESLTKFSSLLNTNSSVDEKDIQNICNNINKDPNILIDVISNIVKTSYHGNYEGRSIIFSDNESNKDTDRLWKEAAKSGKNK